MEEYHVTCEYHGKAGEPATQELGALSAEGETRPLHQGL